MCAEAVAVADVVELLHDGHHPALLARVPDGVRVTEVSEQVMRRLSDATTPAGVVAVVRTPDLERAVPATGPVLVLDGVGDPGNVGTLVRTAAAFGAAVLSLGGADPFGPKAVRASAGACYRTSMHRRDAGPDLVATLEGEGRPVVGLAAQGSVTLDELAGRSPAAGIVLVVGSEPNGLSVPVRDAIDELVRIPMASGIESLNVAAAGAIAMHALMAGRARP